MLGFALLVTPLAAGLFLEREFRHAPEGEFRTSLARVMRRIGLFSPAAMLILLITGIGNMHFHHYNYENAPPWLTLKIVLFVIAVIFGILFAIRSARRARFMKQPGPDHEKLLRKANRQVTFSYVVLWVIVLMILYLTVSGVSGAL